jgi:hypothetical protein
MSRAMLARLSPVAGLLTVLLGLFLGARRLLAGARTINGAVLHTPTDDTVMDEHGAVRSVQGADIILPEAALDGLWNPEHLERLARTYWTSLSRYTLGLVRVHYTETERYVVLLLPFIKLLTFRAPEYEMNACTGIVRWRIEKGLFVASQGREGDGYLEIEVQRHDYHDWNKVRIHVEVEVANFYPAIASRISRWVYANTQSRIHVLVCHAFLRSLVKHDLARSRVGRFAGPGHADDTPDPRRAASPERTAVRMG